MNPVRSRVGRLVLYIKPNVHVSVCPIHGGVERRKQYSKRGELFERVNMRKSSYGRTDNESGTEELGVIWEGLNGESNTEKKKNRRSMMSSYPFARPKF